MRRLTEIDYADTVITGPTVEPVDLDEMKKAIRFTSTSEDTLLDTWISAARQAIELATGRQLISATWERALDQFPSQRAIELPYPPLQSVLSVKYDDADGAEQVMDPTTYHVDVEAGPQAGRGRVVLNIGESWPSAGWVPRAVRIRFVAGYGNTPGSVPELLKTALYLLVGHFHRNRSEVSETRVLGNALQVLPMGAQAILSSFRETARERLVPRV